MKKAIIIAMAFVGVLMLSGCGHNVGLVGLGTGWRIGNGEYGFAYGEGLFGTFVTKDGVHFKAELDSTTGCSYDPSTGTYKGIKSIEYSLPPQVTGYAVEFAKENPEVARAYYDSLVKYYESKEKDVVMTAPLISEEKSKDATISVAEILKKAVAKAKELIEKKEKEEGSEAVFQCDGNCEYTDLTGNQDISYQVSIAMKLLTYNGWAQKFETTGEYYATTLEHFITQLMQHQGLGATTTPLTVKYVKVEDKVITKLMYSLVQEDGTRIDVDCPSCVAY